MVEALRSWDKELAGCDRCRSGDDEYVLETLQDASGNKITVKTTADRSFIESTDNCWAWDTPLILMQFRSENEGIQDYDLYRSSLEDGEYCEYFILTRPILKVPLVISKEVAERFLNDPLAGYNYLLSQEKKRTCDGCRECWNLSQVKTLQSPWGKEVTAEIVKLQTADNCTYATSQILMRYRGNGHTREFDVCRVRENGTGEWVYFMSDFWSPPFFISKNEAEKYLENPIAAASDLHNRWMTRYR